MLLAHTVPWGRLSVDGRSLDDLHSFIDRIDGYPAVRLPAGAHTITYAADQFPTLTCTVTIPFTTPRTAPADAHDLRRSAVPRRPSARWRARRTYSLIYARRWTGSPLLPSRN